MILECNHQNHQCVIIVFQICSINSFVFTLWQFHTFCLHEVLSSILVLHPDTQITQTDRLTHTDRHTDRQTHRHTPKYRHRQTHIDKHTRTHTQTHTPKHTDGHPHTQKHTQIHTHRHTHKHTILPLFLQVPNSVS